MSFEFDAPEDIGGEGDGLKAPGVYHMTVTQIHEGTSNKGKVIDGFTADLSVIGGEQADKTYHLALFNADMSKSEDSQAWSRRKQAAFLIATNLMRPDQLGTPVKIDLAKAEGHQLVIELAEEEYEGKTNLRLAYANIWHVDDPRAAKYAKDESALSIIPEEFRHAADANAYFAKLLKKKPGSGGSQKPAAALSSSQLDAL